MSGATGAAAGSPRSDTPKCFHILGVRIDAVQIPEVTNWIEQRIAQRNGCSFIAVAAMHSVTAARHDPHFKDMLNSADLTVPDGMPLVWRGRLQGCSLKRRVYGPELMATFCSQTASKGYRHFFYGGVPGVAETLARKFASQYPGIKIAGAYCPPFRALTAKEDRDVIAKMEDAQADIVWVGVSTPKQELWMFEHRERLRVPVLVGVGAAFDFHTGRMPQAPAWMGEHGLEWLFRLGTEPRRLWRRYLINGSEFLALAVLESLGLKKFH
jgi:N-acetylglucosaminyldiphosphoundecaprenol N-acetyl-beta-D-mannosaminyltransferase